MKEFTLNRKRPVRKSIFYLFLLTGLFFLVFNPSLSYGEGERIRGWITGERCAEAGRILDCYRSRAYPMVLWTEEGKTYHLELLGEGLDQVSLDKAFGREVVVEGWILSKQIMVVKMTVLKGIGGKEFFKG